MSGHICLIELRKFTRWGWSVPLPGCRHRVWE